jgi:hypothetical protein
MVRGICINISIIIEYFSGKKWRFCDCSSCCSRRGRSFSFKISISSLRSGIILAIRVVEIIFYLVLFDSIQICNLNS